VCVCGWGTLPRAPNLRRRWPVYPRAVTVQRSDKLGSLQCIAMNWNQEWSMIEATCNDWETDPDLKTAGWDCSRSQGSFNSSDWLEIRRVAAVSRQLTGLLFERISRQDEATNRVPTTRKSRCSGVLSTLRLQGGTMTRIWTHPSLVSLEWGPSRSLPSAWASGFYFDRTVPTLVFYKLYYLPKIRPSHILSIPYPSHDASSCDRVGAAV